MHVLEELVQRVDSRLGRKRTAAQAGLPDGTAEEPKEEAGAAGAQGAAAAVAVGEAVAAAVMAMAAEAEAEAAVAGLAALGAQHE